jgi:hypothetical protein
VRKNQSQPNATTANLRWNYEVRLLAWMATCISVFSFLFYFRNGDVLLYGDAVAHINIARRAFDSKTPGLLQLGTVWLPLPHLLMMPFLIFDKLWRNGVGGSLPSMVSYVFGVIGIFRLTRALADGERLGNEGQRSGGRQLETMPDLAANLAPWLAAGVYGANPNLIYMQTTAMGEALYLAFFIWAVVHFTEFLRGDSKTLTKCGLCLAAASLTRYDGWFLAAVTMTAALAAMAFPKLRADPDRGGRPLSFSRGSIAKFLLISVAAPALWLTYNTAVYGNPFEFANGPYSAKAIEKKTATVNPASGNLYAAGSYFLKSAELNVAEPEWLSRLLLALAVAGLLSTLWMRPNAWPLLLLWIPLPFYALSVAYGAIPIFIPQWWPHSQYNVRYGLELLPAFAVSLALLLQLVFPIRGSNKEISQDLRRLRTAAAFVIFGVVVGGYSSVWSANPICYREAATNMRGRIALENQLANWLEVLPPNSTLLMYLGEHPGIVERADFSIIRTINEGNHRVWKQPSDPEGLWERALQNPAEFADYALAFEGDPVFQALAGRAFKELVEIKTTGQSRAVLYQLR